jgi:hypothetical protein
MEIRYFVSKFTIKYAKPDKVACCFINTLTITRGLDPRIQLSNVFR